MQLPGLTIGIVADDMTGANDTALQFFLVSTPPKVILDLHHAPETEDGDPTQVWSINTQSRYLDAHEAQATVRRATALLRDRYGVVHFYKKIDSTLRGNIAHECLGMLDELKLQCAVIVPAFPQEGRRTVGGYQLVRGIPVERTSTARDLLFPIRSSHIPTLLEHVTIPEIVGHIELSTVLHGAGPLVVALNDMIREGKKLVVVDATSNEDLNQIALAIDKLQNTTRILPCGSAGLAHALTRLWGTKREEPCPKVTASGSPVLVISGSNTDVTRNQLVQLIDAYPYYGEGSNLEVFDIAPEQLLNPTEDWDALANQIVRALAERNSVILSTALKETNYARTFELAERQGMSDSDISNRAQETLGILASRILARQSPKLVLTGGEVAYHVCRAIGSHVLKIVDEAEPSIPLTLDERGRWIITKSGSFGGPMALANIIKYIKHRETTHV